MPYQQTRVLIVEDEVRFAESLCRGLRGDGYTVEVVHDGATALTILDSSSFDIVILDRDLPILHGDIVARTLRDQASPVRVLMLTAAASLRDEVIGLDLGADDYLGKPFDYDVLLAHLRALERRLKPQSGAYVSADLRMDFGARRVSIGEELVHLRPKEFAVLAELIRVGGRVVSTSTLFDTVWGWDDETNEAVVKTVIHSLRKKVGASRIITVHGVGYRVSET